MWTDELKEAAKIEGWQLSTLFDNGDSHPMLIATAVARSPVGQLIQDASIREVGQFIIDQAKRHSRLHQLALRAVAASRIRSKGARK